MFFFFVLSFFLQSLIVVVDSTDRERLSVCKEELFRMLTHEVRLVSGAVLAVPVCLPLLALSLFFFSVLLSHLFLSIFFDQMCRLKPFLLRVK